MGFEKTYSLLLPRNDSVKGQLNFVKTTSCTPYLVKRHLIYQELITSEVLSVTEILLPLIVKRLAVEQKRFLKRK